MAILLPALIITTRRTRPPLNIAFNLLKKRVSCFPYKIGFIMWTVIQRSGGPKCRWRHLGEVGDQNADGNTLEKWETKMQTKIPWRSGNKNYNTLKKWGIIMRATMP